MEKTKIETFDATWNPVVGCLHGCEYCYARDIAHRFGGWTDSDGDMHHDEILKNESKIRELVKPLKVFREGQTIFSGKWQNAPYPYDFIPTFHRYRLNDYVGKKGRNIFVCSMADLFGSWVPDEWIKEVFAACEKALQHNYLFLTKNPGRYIELSRKGLLPNRHWYGYSATKQSDLWEFHHADDCTVKNLFVSIEPMLEPMNPGFCSHCPADWVIIGAETGRRKDKVVPKREWIERIVMECKYSDIPLFMKSSLAEIWGEPLIQEFPEGLKRKG